MSRPTSTALRRAARAPVTAAVVCAAVFTAGPAALGADTNPSAQQLADDARTALLKAHSLHLVLTNHARTPRDTRTPRVFDLRLDDKGDCTGFLRMGTGGADGGSVRLVKRGDQVWMKPDTTFWKTQVPGRPGELAAQVFDGRYLHGTTDDPALSGLANTCDLDAFRGRLEQGSGRDAQDHLTKGKPTEVGGEKVVPLTGHQGRTTVTLDVTSDAPHRLVRATEKGPGVDITMTLGDYDKPVPDKTPPSDQSVDVSKLHDLMPDSTPSQSA
ncbi:LolA-like protein [Streptomyces beihaiensis]|uniref:Lipoprotein n=1 Tax=Streptomyces beihaiensis TaxID=2984495 RepID=A0ABT3TX48_9ACTN|nr:hypothetical protein [Streptomyces beihaiensis]MCX3061625.1 hypothetical protein [Streptomyces beihaiensis]